MLIETTTPRSRRAGRDLPADDHAGAQAQRLARAGRRQQDRARGRAAAASAWPTSTRMRVATKTISGLYDGATTRELDQLSIQTAAASSSRSRSTRKLAARLLATYIDKEVRGPGDPRLLAVGRGRRTRLGLVNDRLADFVAEQRPQAQRRHRSPSATASSSTSACARSTTATCCKHPQTRAGDRDAAAVLPARRLRAVRDACRRRSSSTGCSRRSSTCPARPRCSTRARGTSSSRAASCSTRPTTTWRTSTSATPTSRCSRSSRAASASPTTACARAAR